MGAIPTPGVQECNTIQLLEPDGDVPVAVQGGVDSALDERGQVVLTDGQSEVSVEFTKPKLNANYRFEYLYVDTLGLVQPGVISAVPVTQTTMGFVVELAGAAIGTGYILRWRVVIVDAEVVSSPTPDVPESIYVNLPQNNVFSYNFQNPRSTQDYGFSELRVENLIDLPGAQIPIFPQVIVKQEQAFTVLLSQTPNNGNYYLVARTP